jgi:uncharacterized damage-inducible protein DinB
MDKSNSFAPRDQILALREFEFATTMRVLRAYPEDKLDLRPAEKSRSARELIRTFVLEELVCGAAMRGEPILGVAGQILPNKLTDLLENFDRIHQDVQNSVAHAPPDETLDRVTDFYGHQISVLEVLWAELLDQIHHRGQLSVYLRLAGARVPSIYGPTADEPAGTQN